MTPSGIAELRERFDAADRSVRIIAFLSPTCGPCRYGQGVVQGLFEALPETDLRGYIVWVPMLPADNAGEAAAEQARIKDSRIEFWYDADRASAREWSAIMGLTGDAWDVYAVYAREDRWDTIASPRVWMHQLDFEPGTRAEDRLDTGRLAREALSLLGGDPATAPDLRTALHRRGLEVSIR